MKYLYLPKLIVLGIILFSDITYNIGYSLYNIDKIKKVSFLSKMIYSYRDDTIEDKNLQNAIISNNLISNNLRLNNLRLNNLIIRNIICNKNNNMKCIILIDHNQKEIYTVFKGTTTITDWFYNFNIFPVKFANCTLFEVHSVIYKLYCSDNFNNNIINNLLQINKENRLYKNYICGHSRGGVHSQLLSFELYKKNPKLDIEVYTFGSPFLLNKALCDYLTNNRKIEINNIINENDILPYINFYYAKPFGNMLTLKNNLLIVNKSFNQKKTDMSLLYNSIINIKSYIYYHNISSYHTYINKL